MTAPSYSDQVMDALLALLRDSCGDLFRTYSRRFVTFESLTLGQQGVGGPFITQPALILFDGMGLGGGQDRYEPRGRASPTVKTLSRSIVIYATLPGVGTPSGMNSTVPGGTIFYPLIEAVENAIETFRIESATNAQTLGGLVSHCWIEGDSVIITGELDTSSGQGMAILPCRIMLFPNSR